MKTHSSGCRSPRMKDLGDVVAYALTQLPSSNGLSAAIENECVQHSMGIPQRFEAPEEWKAGYQSFALKAKVPEAYRPFDQSYRLTSELFDPVLKGQIERQQWNLDILTWE